MTPDGSQRQWYILQHLQPAGATNRHVAAETIDGYNRAHGADLELFAPTMTQLVQRDGQYIRRIVPLAYHYVFVRGTDSRVRQLCRVSGRFAFLMNRGSQRRHATVSDSQLDGMRLIAMHFNNTLPFFDLSDIDLEEGDLVEVVEGAFPGLVGYYMPRNRSNSGDLVLSVSGELGSIVYDIPARYVRVLEFSRKSRRGYDQIDAFVPQLLQALRGYHRRQPLEPSLLTRLTVFCRRMEHAKMPNAKIQAKLMMLIGAAQIILGNAEAARAADLRVRQLLPRVTAAQTLGLHLLLRGVIDNDPAQLIEARQHLTAATPSHATQALLDELDYYGF